MAVFTRINGDAYGVVNVDAGRVINANGAIVNTGIAAPLTFTTITLATGAPSGSYGNLAPESTTGGAVLATISSTSSIIGSSLVANTAVTVNTTGYLTTTSYTTTASASQVTVDTFSATTYRTGKYLASITQGTNYHTIELLVIQNGSAAWLAQYGEIFTNTSLGTFDASVVGGIVNLLFTPASASVTTVNLVRTTVVV